MVSSLGFGGLGFGFRLSLPPLYPNLDYHVNIKIKRRVFFSQYPETTTKKGRSSRSAPEKMRR